MSQLGLGCANKDGHPIDVLNASLLLPIAGEVVASPRFSESCQKRECNHRICTSGKLGPELMEYHLGSH
jgi:hypothetical protein